jgi:hypothetical protein
METEIIDASLCWWTLTAPQTMQKVVMEPDVGVSNDE